MKRLSSSELALVCAPLLLVAPAIFFLTYYLKPSPASITLTVKADPTYKGDDPHFMQFGWIATAKDRSGGGGIDVQYAERVIASGYGHSQVIYDATSQSTKTKTSYELSGGFVMMTSEAGLHQAKMRLGCSWYELPLWINKLEWQGDVVAIPHTSRSASLTISQLARIPGAVRVTKRLLIASGIKQLNPIQKCYLSSVEDQNRALCADRCVTVEFKEGRRKVFRQLVAFDGKKTRVLWRDFTSDVKHYHPSEQTGSTWQTNAFNLKHVPSSWGKITFSLEAVFAPYPNIVRDLEGMDNTPTDKATINKLKAQGWIYESRQLVVRS